MSDEIETIDKNPKSWAAWKREAERLQAIIDDMVLAAMDSEPVAFTEKHEISNMHATGLYLRAWPADRARNAVEGYTIPLYLHAQPVVPDGLVKAVEFYEQVKRENPPVETGAWKDAVDWVLKEACCAAMPAPASQENN